MISNLSFLFKNLSFWETEIDKHETTTVIKRIIFIKFQFGLEHQRMVISTDHWKNVTAKICIPWKTSREIFVIICLKCMVLNAYPMIMCI